MASEHNGGGGETVGLFDPLFGRTEIAALLSDRARIQGMLDFEAALAAAEAEAGVVPAAAVEPIRHACRAEHYDLPTIARDAAQAGNLAIPLVKALTREVAAVDPEAARYVHWGATSQDVIDTGAVLQIRSAMALVESRLGSLGDRLAELAARHRATPMIGRTFLQHAVPITFGLKAAGWLAALTRHRARLHEMGQRLYVLQFGGAAGTLSALGPNGLAIAEALAAELKLHLLDLPWHSHRDGIAELGSALASLTGSLGKIARDLSLLAQTEVGEVREGAAAGRGGSSTMPHKRNPVAAMAVLANAQQAPGLAATLLHSLDQTHERGIGPWHAEWETWPRLVGLAFGSLALLDEAVVGIEVDEARMRRNLDLTGGLVMTEAVQMALAERVGRDRAHDLLEAVSKRVATGGIGLREALLANPEVTANIAAAELDVCLDPAAYLGQAEVFVDRAVAGWQKSSIR